MDYKEVKKNKGEEINKIILHLNNKEEIVIKKGIVITISEENDESIDFTMQFCNLSGKEFYKNIQGLVGLATRTIGVKEIIRLAKYFSDDNTTSNIKISGTKYNENSENY